MLHYVSKRGPRSHVRPRQKRFTPDEKRLLDEFTFFVNRRSLNIEVPQWVIADEIRLLADSPIKITQSGVSRMLRRAGIPKNEAVIGALKRWVEGQKNIRVEEG